MAITLSNGKEVNLYSARFLHIYLLWKGQSKELGDSKKAKLLVRSVRLQRQLCKAIFTQTLCSSTLKTIQGL